MKLEDLCSYLDSAVPLSFQESYDNSGLQVGLMDNDITAGLLALDVTEEVVNEAVAKKCDVIIAHHPLIFNGIKSVTGKSYTERIIYSAIQNNVAIYSAHTNLDVLSNGVSRKMAEKLSLNEIRVLSPLKNRMLKLVTFVPESHFEQVKAALFEAGAGVTGNYDNCGFSVQGTGSFRGGESTTPFAGVKGKVHFEPELRFETVLFSHLKGQVVKALLEAHPYEEVAYDIIPLGNVLSEVGLGCVGELSHEMEEHDFLQHVASVYDSQGLRYSNKIGKLVKKVALCGGAGFSLLNDAISCGADVFLTSDIKYHNYFDAEKKILLVDTGHFESEKFSTEIIYDLVIKKFPKFAVRFSETKTNPINYL